jgi:hypothetical protein
VRTIGRTDRRTQGRIICPKSSFRAYKKLRPYVTDCRLSIVGFPFAPFFAYFSHMCLYQYLLDVCQDLLINLSRNYNDILLVKWIKIWNQFCEWSCIIVFTNLSFFKGLSRKTNMEKVLPAYIPGHPVWHPLAVLILPLIILYQNKIFQIQIGFSLHIYIYIYFINSSLCY